MKKLFALVTLICASFTISAASTPIVPIPLSATISQGKLTIPSTITLFDCGHKTLTDYVSAEFLQRFGLAVKTAKSNNSFIKINIADKNCAAESYTLEITPKNIIINGAGPAGAFYGVQSLMQLMQAGSDGSAGGKITLNAQKITDAPRFSWRSLLFDDARHFKGVAEVKRTLDAMAALKMNIFHWHLTDDSGWRIEIKKYPLLTQIGGRRTDTQVGGWDSEKRAGKPHEGFYTQAQIADIVAYAKARHIKIVPEIETPGHASAAIAAYPWLGSSEGQIEVPHTFGKHFAIFNVTDRKVEQFIKDIIDEIAPLFQTDVIHIGGDEVRFDQWEQNPQIAAYKEAKGYNSFMDIQIEYTNRMSHYFQDKSLTMMGWSELLGKNLHQGEISFSDPSQKVADNVIVQFWKGDINELIAAAKGGYKLVNSHHIATYLDYSYKTIPLKAAYDFNPVPDGLPAEFAANIIGSGCQMWCEWVSDAGRLHYQLYPRLAAYAEVGWSAADRKDYADFIGRLAPIIKNWKAAGITPAPLSEVR